MEWYLIDMPQASLTDGGYHRLCREFQRAFIDAGAPVDLALFAERESASVRRLYLSPQSGTYVPDIINHYDARVCGVPDPASVTLVYGVPGARSLLIATPAPSSSSTSSETTIYPLTTTRPAASAG